MEGPGSAAPRPLRGKSFYLDLPSGRDARELAAAIGRLGGVTESFLSKEVSCVVSSNSEAKRDKARSWPEKQSNGTSEGAKAPSLMPSASKGQHTRPQQKPPDTALISRGRELLQKAMKNQDTCSGSSILARARLWGVQILHVDDMLAYTQQLLRAASGARRPCQKTEAKCPASGWKSHKGKLKPPFLKVEDQSRQFRPFYQQFKSFPSLNLLGPKGCSPFEPLKSLPEPCRARAVEGCPVCSEGEKSPRSTPATVPKRRRGFCECCQETFEELQEHLRSPRHRRFALDPSHYAAVDHLIAQLPTSLLHHSARMPQSCLADEHLVPQAQVPGGFELLTAELGKEREQPEQAAVEVLIDLECDHSLETKSCSPCLAPGGGWGFSKHHPVGLPAGAGLSRRLCAVPGTTEEPAVRDTALGLAPGLGWGSHVVAAPVGERTAPSEQPGSESHPAGALPAPRKRHLSSRQSSQVGKKPRLELGGGLSACELSDPVGAGLGAGQTSEAGLPGLVESGSLALSTKLSSRPQSSLGLDLCLCWHPGDLIPWAGSLEAVSMGFHPPEAAASPMGRCGWGRAGCQGRQLPGHSEKVPSSLHAPDLENSMSHTSCPPGQLPSPKLPVAGARCCCSLCARAAEKAAPELPALPGLSRERAPCPGLLQPLPHNTEAGHYLSRSSSESDWDVQLLSVLPGAQDSRLQPMDRDLLQRTHINVRDSGYESQLCSVLKQKSELAWAGREDKNCWNCFTETTGASYPFLVPPVPVEASVPAREMVLGAGWWGGEQELRYWGQGSVGDTDPGARPARSVIPAEPRCCNATGVPAALRQPGLAGGSGGSRDRGGAALPGPGGRSLPGPGRRDQRERRDGQDGPRLHGPGAAAFGL
ncbi:protein DBF4 homolog B [Indicator indicator]|uniref:protein DBF4 homolog B n=1 Tax=Indicator indicator TaxID=1002788 RepID=UPI0023DF1DD7|nr:protein DBF4 homolog B [Indicator indicator]